MIEAINGNRVHDSREFFVWVDRRSVLGNPFPMRSEDQRETVIQQYRVWLWQRLQTKTVPVLREMHRILRLEKQYGTVRLMCHCKPKACHADVLIKALNWMKQRA